MVMLLRVAKALRTCHEPGTAKRFTDTHSQLWEVTVVTSQKRGFREVRCLAQGHTAGQWGVRSQA